jgi:hypothetical protein
MIIKLEAVSPISFMVIRTGDVLRIKHKEAKLNEYRDKIGPAANSYLIFKDETKVGVITGKAALTIPNIASARACRVTKIDPEQGLIEVQLPRPRVGHSPNSPV